MARASTYTKVPLDNFAKHFGLHPLHFNQVRIDTNPHCDHIMFQHEWQTADHVGREEIARALADAEAQIEEYLGYHLAPTWDVDEWRPTDRYYQPEMVNRYSSDVRGYMQTVRAKWGYLISGGVQAKELVSAGAAIVYSDPDSDGYSERATVTVATTATRREEIAVFYPGNSGEDIWEIRPVEVSIAGGVATITFSRHQAVDPNLFDVLDIEGNEAVGTDNGDFLTTVDVYRRYNDPQTQASFLWEPLAGGFCNCGLNGCPSCSYSTQTGCLLLRGDPRISMCVYHPGNWDADTLDFTNVAWAVTRQPDIVRLFYYSGWRNKSQVYTNRMDPEWERVVVRMAAAKLDRPPCDCAKGDWSRWREDLTLVSGDEDGKPYYRNPSGILDNPFGSRRGEVEAWRKVKHLMTAQAVAL